MSQDKLFYVGQKAIINRGGKVLILRDSVLKTIDLPGGKIQERELDFMKALKREVHEEIGIKIKVNEICSIGYFKVPKKSNHRSAGKEIFLIFYGCEYVNGKIKLSVEHDWYKWVDKNDFKKYIKEKTNIYNSLLNYFQ